MLTEAEDIVNRYQILDAKAQKKSYFKRDSKGKLKTEKIALLEAKLSKA